MTWKADDPQGDEVGKIRWEVVHYTRGKGLDLGCGPNKLWPGGNCIGVDNHKDTQMFGIQMKPDIVQDITDLSMFATGSMDYVFSSHALEHFDIELVPKILREWMRVLKVGGYLALYLPWEGAYPRVGEPGANPDHKWNVNLGLVLACMDRTGTGFELVDYQERTKGREYSLLLVFKKNKNPNKQDHLAFHKLDQKREPIDVKRAAVLRYGAIGDTVQAASVCAALKKQGYHVTFFGTHPATEVVAFDPNIDHIYVQGFDQIPNEWLGHFFKYQEAKFDKWVNLTESAEANLLATKENIRFHWPPTARHKLMNHNYLELQHLIAGVPYEPHLRFYPNDDERKWAQTQHSAITHLTRVERVVMWALAGSGRVHKLWPYADKLIESTLQHCPDAAVITVGDGPAKDLEPDGGHTRLIKTCGKWTIRQVLAMLHLGYVDVLVGPETGVLNSAAMLNIPKVLLLSHSTQENLCRDWINTAGIYSPNTVCPGRGNNETLACHQMHPTFGPGCRRDEATGVAQCSTDIKPQWVWAQLFRAIRTGKVDSPWVPPVESRENTSP